MKELKNLENRIFNIDSEQQFNETALDIFHFQAKENPVYKEFLSIIKTNRNNIKNYADIPFLPIELFKTRDIYIGEKDPEIIFSSSGTTGTVQSKHYVANLKLYQHSFEIGFKQFYGNPSNYVILALLPSYLEREGSSLIYMVQQLVKKSNSEHSGFYLDELGDLSLLLKRLDKEGKKIILLGVTYALLDLIENETFQLKNTIIMETGGMKGKRKEMVRNELHDTLCKGFGVNKIHSEYGMTELLSQAYSKGDGIFQTPSWMKIIIRDINDPKTRLSNNKTGGVNIIDLANIYSCSFISSNDLGRINNNGFEILGRFDYSDVRGCNLLVES